MPDETPHAPAMLWNAWAHVRDAKEQLEKDVGNISCRNAEDRQRYALFEPYLQGYSNALRILLLLANLMTAEHDWEKYISKLKNGATP